MMVNEKYNIPSEIGAKSYWNNEGQFQKEYDELYNELVPASGRSETLFGEVIRAVSRLGYEYLNNGNCNARETTEIEDDEDSYYEESEYDYISDFYSEFMHLPREFFKQYNVDKIGEKYLERIESIILTCDDTSNYFNDKNRQAYDAIVDITVAVILKEGVKNSPKLPGWYKN